MLNRLKEYIEALYKAAKSAKATKYILDVLKNLVELISRLF
jgi:hypothetical protein